MKSGIYQIICLVNGKIYIGSAVNLYERWRKHKLVLSKKIHRNKYLQRSWIKYGEEYFDFDIIEYCEKDNLTQREQYYLDILKPEFNICKTAGSSLGLKHSEESKEKMKGNTNGKGYKHTKETRIKISLALIGKTRTYNKTKRKFPDEWIREIRTSKLSKSELAKEYNCCPKEIWQIINYIIYKDII